MTVYYFAYGANLSPKELDHCNFKYEWKKTCILNNYELKLNHLSIPFLIPSYFNIQSNKGKKVHGILYKSDKKNLLRLEEKELFYKLIEINIKINDKNYKAITFQSNITNNYHKKIDNHYKNLVIENLKIINAPKKYIKNIEKYELFEYKYLKILLVLITLYIIYKILSFRI